MSSAPLDRNQHSNNENRRVHVRRRIDQLTYAKFGPDNGGILINLSEGGLSFQGVGVVGRDEVLRVNFTLPGMPPQIEATGQIVWSNDSGKGGGLRFLNLNEETRRRIKEWIARDGSPEGTLAEEVTIPVAAASVGASDRNFVQSLPPLEKKEQPTNPAPKPQPRPIKWQTSSSTPTAATISNIAGAAAPRVPRILPEFYEPTQAPNTPKPQFVAFATGVMAGCVVVLAAIAGVRMLGNSGRPTNAVAAHPPAGQRTTAPASENTPVDGIGLNDRPLTLNNNTVATIPAAGQGSVSKTPSRESGAPARSEPSFKGLEEPPQRDNLTDLALATPRVPNAPSMAEIRQPSIDDGEPSGFSSIDEKRAVPLSSMPDPRKPPQPLPEKVDRTSRFVEPVLIEQSAPIYPSNARANHIEGAVKLSATIGTDGVPRQLKLVSGDLSLARAAEEAVSHWRYVPAVFRGAPVESNIIITIKFELKQ